MDPNVYKIIHIVGLAMLFFAFGGIFAPRSEGEKAPRIYKMLHGIGLLAMVVAGFGRASKIGISMSAGWIWVKIALWLLLGALPTLVNKGVVPRPLAWVVGLAVVALGAWLAIQKPF
jgi:hypothetical protein